MVDADEPPAELPTPPEGRTSTKITSEGSPASANDGPDAHTSTKRQKPRWWQPAAEHWQLTLFIVAVVGAVGGLGAWVPLITGSPDPQPMPTPQVPVQIGPQPAGSNSSQPIAQNPEPVPGESACRDSPDDSAGLGGWGPARNPLPTDRVSEFPSFNIDDIPPFGNERWFLDVRDTALPKDARWQSKIKVERGKTYILRAFIHNSAGTSNDGVAQDTRISVNLPTCTGRRIASQMTISSSNAEPKMVWDSVHFTADERFNLAYVPGSAVLCNNFYLCKGLAEGMNDGAEISNDFLTRTGALIGFDALNGSMRGGYEYSAYFYFEVRPQFAPPS